MLQSDFPSHADGTALYALGVYDESEGSFEHATGLQEPRALDLSQTYVYNQLGYRSDGRMVNVGWIRDLGTSVVREVRYDPTVGGGQLLAWPVEELHELRQEVLGSSKGKLLQANHTESLVTSGATAADMEFLFATFADAPLEVTVTALGLTVDLSVHGSNATIAVNRAEAATSTPGLQSAAARLSNAAAVPRNGVDCGGNFFVPKNLTQVSLRILIDGVSIEAFAVDGRGVCSFAHPTPPPKSSSAVLITSGRAETTLLNATVWRMGAISYS
jgi:sucrose-6-phosphate hydrolase SacC (GH32 family)